MSFLSPGNSRGNPELNAELSREIEREIEANAELASQLHSAGTGQDGLLRRGLRRVRLVLRRAQPSGEQP